MRLKTLIIFIESFFNFYSNSNLGAKNRQGVRRKLTVGGGVGGEIKRIEGGRVGLPRADLGRKLT